MARNDVSITSFNTRMVAVESYMFSSGRSFFLGHVFFHLFVKPILNDKIESPDLRRVQERKVRN